MEQFKKWTAPKVDSSYLRAANSPEDFIRRKKEEDAEWQKMLGKSHDEHYADMAKNYQSEEYASHIDDSALRQSVRQSLHAAGSLGGGNAAATFSATAPSYGADTAKPQAATPAASGISQLLGSTAPTFADFVAGTAKSRAAAPAASGISQRLGSTASAFGGVQSGVSSGARSNVQNSAPNTARGNAQSNVSSGTQGGSSMEEIVKRWEDQLRAERQPTEESMWKAITRRPVSELYEQKARSQQQNQPQQSAESLLQKMQADATLRQKEINDLRRKNGVQNLPYQSSGQGDFISPLPAQMPQSGFRTLSAKTPESATQYSDAVNEYTSSQSSDEFERQALENALSDYDKQAGLKVVLTPEGNRIDYTEPIMKRLENAEKEFAAHRMPNANEKRLGVISPLVAKSNGVRAAISSLWFASQVANNRPWDIKRTPSWKEQFGDELLPPANAGDPIAFEGKSITPEDLGNLTYGYLGSAAGYTLEELYLGGGVANQWTRNGIEGTLNISNYLPKNSYGDDAMDIERIKQGVELYQRTHGGK